MLPWRAGVRGAVAPSRARASVTRPRVAAPEALGSAPDAKDSAHLARSRRSCADHARPWGHCHCHLACGDVPQAERSFGIGMARRYLIGDRKGVPDMGAAVSETVVPAPSAARAWRVRLTDEPDAVVRVLTLLRRRRCRIQRIDYDAGDRHRPATWLRVAAVPNGGRPDAIEAWLGGLPDVLELARER